MTDVSRLIELYWPDQPLTDLQKRLYQSILGHLDEKDLELALHELLGKWETVPPPGVIKAVAEHAAVSTGDTPTEPSRNQATDLSAGAPSGNPNQKKWVIGGIVAAAVLIGAAVGVVIYSTGNSAGATPNLSTLTSAAPPVTPTQTAPSASQTESTQAQALSALLLDSSSDRKSLVAAVDDLESCTDVSQAASELNAVAASRSSLLTQLSGLDLSLVPNQAELQSLLTTALQYSVQSDTSYAAWASDLESSCTPSSVDGDPNYEAAQTTDPEAEAAKAQFVSIWNPVASSLGLPTQTDNSF